MTLIAFAIAHVLLTSRAAQSAESTVITLSCEGTYTTPGGTDSFPNTSGVVVNLDESKLSFGAYLIPITKTNDAEINFGDLVMGSEISGSINRVTGEMYVERAIAEGSPRAMTWDFIASQQIVCSEWRTRLQ